MTIPLGCIQCKGSGMVEVKQNLSGDPQFGTIFRTPLGNVITKPEATILCDCQKGRAIHELQGGEGRTSGKMPIFDPMTMELADGQRERPVNVASSWESM